MKKAEEDHLLVIEIYFAAIVIKHHKQNDEYVLRTHGLCVSLQQKETTVKNINFLLSYLPNKLMNELLISTTHSKSFA